MVKKKTWNWVFWIGFIILIFNLMSYVSAIQTYFSTLGIALLILSILLIGISKFLSQ